MSKGRQLRSILALPFNVTITVPALLLWWKGSEPGFGAGGSAAIVGGIVGAGFIALGLVLMVSTIRLFTRVGHGTLAPWDPTEHLVVEGPYRYVRNPMISGVGAVLLGESLLTGSLTLLGWFAIFMLVNAIYMPLSEEPGLIRRFGDEYREYARHVPRWIPRPTPWEPTAS
jgi:protein-S-isoprenylcysteine O-methyltransferase Ste14